MPSRAQREARRQLFVPPDPGSRPDLRVCDYPGCTEQGAYRAPQSPQRLRQYFWFCLDHVRAYNAAWNYFEGMSDSQIEDHIRRDAIWDRPTWALGSGPDARDQFRIREQIFNEFGFAGEGEGEDGAEQAVNDHADFKELKALRLLGLEPPSSLEEVKTRYKELAKTLHPDRNPDDPLAEEKLKVINQAYQILKTAFA